MKETQGRKKMLQRIEDLVRNKYFIKELKRYQKARTDSDQKLTPKLWNIIFTQYIELGDTTRRMMKKTQKTYEKVSDKLANQYGVDSRLLDYILSRQDKTFSDFNPFLDYVDMCFWEDGRDELLPKYMEEIPLIFHPTKRNQWKVYPVSLRLHMFASKRDVIDYIEKNWGRIYEALGIYTDYKKVVIRKRKTNREILDFIWKNRMYSGKDIKKKLDEKFPKNSLTYYEIPKIISLEKEKRLDF